MLKKLIKLINYYRMSNEDYARKIGVTLGSDNFISDKRHWSSEPYLITIGSHCQITRGAVFATHGGGQCIRDKHPDFDCFGKIAVGDWVYIGANAIIMPGVTIGDNVLVAAGSIVTKSIPSGMVVAGNPARVICTTDEYYEKNKIYDTHSKGMNPDKKRSLLTNPQSTNSEREGSLQIGGGIRFIIK